MLSVQRLEGWTIDVPPFGDVGRMIGAIGRDGFLGAVLDLLDEAVGVDHIALLRLNDGGLVDFHGATSIGGPQVSEVAARQYFFRFSHLDPIRAIGRVGLADGTGLLVRLHASDVLDPLYRQECWFGPDIGERLTLYAVVDRRIHQVNLYRSSRRPRFDEDAGRSFVSAAGVLLPSLARHAELVTGPDDHHGARMSLEALKHRVEQLDGALSERELEVCARALYGQSIEGTALELGIGRTSVVTYRRRAYGKLRISCHNELFALAF
jgi:DNA-binding CsgD family transcriptional regulator